MVRLLRLMRCGDLGMSSTRWTGCTLRPGGHTANVALRLWWQACGQARCFARRTITGRT